MTEERSSLIPRKNHSYGSTAPNENSTETGIGQNNNSIPNVSIATQSLPTDTPTTPTDQTRSSLSALNKLGFGFGHIYNDLCAGVWFSYTLLFMQGALLMPGPEAGALMMLGQVGDALATPIVGLLADKFGTKQKWHVFGTGLVFLSFPLIFSICPWCTTMPAWWHVIYFSAVILAFQFGWAIVQVTHLAMIPEMSRNQKDRTELTAMRYSASVISNVIVFVVTWAVLRANRVKTDANIGPEDAYRFRDISLILTLIGISMTVCFHFSLALSGYGTRRRQALDYMRRTSSIKRPLIADEEKAPQSTPIVPQSRQRPRKNFFKSALLYQNALLYVFSRLFMTTALVYIPLWLDERSLTPSTNKFPVDSAGPDKSVEHIATVPMVSFLSSFLSSMLMKYSSHLFGHQVAYLLGSVISVSGCVLVSMAASPNSAAYLLYAIAMLFGAGSSITMISSLCITADMIGRHADQSGFIYSAVTFADKLITGVAVIIIESLKCQNRVDCPEYYKNVLAYACGGAALLGALTLFTLKLNRPRRRPTTTTT